MEENYDMVELYFKIKILRVVVVVLVLVILAMRAVVHLITSTIKDKMLVRHGYKFHKGLNGKYIAYEFRDRYRKEGHEDIVADVAYSMSFKELRKVLKNN